jgi:outer membrane murein-binding lipoprotein Lpp
MNIQERIEQSEARFNELSKQRDDINTEMTKLQGEWRVLKELEAAETEPKKANKRATTVEAVPEGESA